MNDISDFQEQYKNSSNAELLYILLNQTEYQISAVSAARIEFDSRLLTQGQLLATQAEVEEKLQSKLIIQQKKKVLADKITTFKTSVADTLNPIQKEPLSVDKYIKIISISLASFFLYNLFYGLRLLIFMIGDISHADSSAIMCFFPFIILPPATILFWLRKKSGWVLAAIFFTTYAIISIRALYSSISMRIKYPGYPDTPFFQIPSPSLSLIPIAIFIAALGIICKPSIRDVYVIHRKRMYITIGIAVLISLIVPY